MTPRLGAGGIYMLSQFGEGMEWGVGWSLIWFTKLTQHYQLLTLWTDTLTAAEFYQKLGFKADPNWEHTTHHLQLSDMEYSPLSLNWGFLC